MPQSKLSGLQNAPRQRPQGRSAKVSAAVQKAVIEVLEARGVARFTLDAVAEASGVNRTTLYRRWQSKERLITWAMLETVKVYIPSPDQGTLERDLFLLARGVRDFLKTPLAAVFAQVLFPQPNADAEVQATLKEFWEERIGLTYLVMDRAVERGEIRKGVSKDELLEGIFGPLYLRYFTGRSALGDARLKKLIQRVVAPHLT